MSALHTCIETNENLDADVTEDLGVVIEGLDAERNRTETSQYGAGYGLIQAEFDTITFQFYDGYSRLIDDFRTIISYNEETKQIEAFDNT